MRDTVPDWVLAESHTVRTTISAWRDGTLVAPDVPLVSGTLDWDADSPVPGRATLRFPTTVMPTGPLDPLNIYGQRLAVQQTITAGGASWTVNLGWWLVQAFDATDAGVDVEALTLEQVILDWRFESPYTRPSNATFMSVLSDLSRGALPARLGDGLDDRAVGATLTEDWDEDRMAAVRALATNWPADIRVNDDGVLDASPVRTVGDPVRHFQHGTPDAYVRASTSGLRDDIYNAVVARGADADGNPVQAFAVDDDATSPTYYYGPFGRRPRFYESPLITSTTQAASAAASVLAGERRRSSQVVIDAPPDPRIEHLDTVAVTDRAGATFTGLVTGITLPLTPGDGAATYRVSRQT